MQEAERRCLDISKQVDAAVGVRLDTERQMREQTNSTITRLQVAETPPHTHCTRTAHALHTPCTRTAHALHMHCTCTDAPCALVLLRHTACSPDAGHHHAHVLHPYCIA